MATNRPCRNCGEQKIDSLKNFPEQICRKCLRDLTRLRCDFCRKDFHLLANANENGPKLCMKCQESFELKGDPHACAICEQNCAWESEICRHCEKHKSKFGEPIECDRCGKRCAFNKKSASRKKVGNQRLCYVCTLDFKIENKAQNNKSSRGGKRTRSETRRDRHDSSPNKRRRLNDSRTSPSDGLSVQGLNPMAERFRKLQQEHQQTLMQLRTARNQMDSFRREKEQWEKERLAKDLQIGELKGQLEQKRSQIERTKEITKRSKSGANVLNQRVNGLIKENAELRAELIREEESSRKFEKMAKKYKKQLIQLQGDSSEEYSDSDRESSATRRKRVVKKKKKKEEPASPPPNASSDDREQTSPTAMDVDDEGDAYDEGKEKKSTRQREKIVYSPQVRAAREYEAQKTQERAQESAKRAAGDQADVPREQVDSKTKSSADSTAQTQQGNGNAESADTDVVMKPVHVVPTNPPAPTQHEEK